MGCISFVGSLPSLLRSLRSLRGGRGIRLRPPVKTAVPSSDFQQLRDQLPEDEDDENWQELFEIVDAGGWNDAMEAQTGGGPQSE